MNMRKLINAARNQFGPHTLVEAALNSDVLHTLERFARLAPKNSWALIGGMAFSTYAKPRYTQDIDVAVKSDSEINDIAQACSAKFKLTRKHALTDKFSGVEVELVTPEWVKQNPSLFRNAIARAEEKQLNASVSIKIVTPIYLAALKLGRCNDQDKSDIKQLERQYGPFNMDKLPLSEKEKSNWKKIQDEMASAEPELEDEPV